MMTEWAMPRLECWFDAQRCPAELNLAAIEKEVTALKPAEQNAHFKESVRPTGPTKDAKAAVAAAAAAAVGRQAAQKPEDPVSECLYDTVSCPHCSMSSCRPAFEHVSQMEADHAFAAQQGLNIRNGGMWTGGWNSIPNGIDKVCEDCSSMAEINRKHAAKASTDTVPTVSAASISALAPQTTPTASLVAAAGPSRSPVASPLASLACADTNSIFRKKLKRCESCNSHRAHWGLPRQNRRWCVCCARGRADAMDSNSQTLSETQKVAESAAEEAAAAVPATKAPLNRTDAEMAPKVYAHAAAKVSTQAQLKAEATARAKARANARAAKDTKTAAAEAKARVAEDLKVTAAAVVAAAARHAARLHSDDESAPGSGSSTAAKLGQMAAGPKTPAATPTRKAAGGQSSEQLVPPVEGRQRPNVVNVGRRSTEWTQEELHSKLRSLLNSMKEPPKAVPSAGTATITALPSGSPAVAGRRAECGDYRRTADKTVPLELMAASLMAASLGDGDAEQAASGSPVASPLASPACADGTTSARQRCMQAAAAAGPAHGSDKVFASAEGIEEPDVVTI